MANPLKPKCVSYIGPFDSYHITKYLESLSEEERYRPRAQFNYARHLDAALEYTKIEFYIRHPEQWKRTFPQLPFKCLHSLGKKYLLGKSIFPTLKRHILNHKQKDKDSSMLGYRSLIELVSDAVTLQAKGTMIAPLTPSLHIIQEKIRAIQNSPKLETAFENKSFVLKIHHEVQKIAEANLYPAKLSVIGNVWMHADLVLFLDCFPKPVILPYHFLLSALDRLEAEYSIYSYVEMADTLPKFSNLEYKELFNSLYHLLEVAALELGNQAPVLFKSLESLALGACLQECPGEVAYEEFLQLGLAGLAEKDSVVHLFACKVSELFVSYLQRHKDDGIPIVLEMFGQEKMHGYPIVSGEGGLTKMYRFGTSIRGVDLNFVDKLTGLFRREWILAKFHEDGVFPALTMCHTVDPVIKDMIAHGRICSDEYCQRIPDTAWNKITFRPHQTFNYFSDILELIDDKSLAPERDNLNQIYPRDMLYVIRERPPLVRSETKLVLRCLKEPEIDVKKMFEQSFANQKLDHKNTLILLKMKELEEKNDGRPFSLLPFEARMMSATLERNLSESVLPKFSTHSMTSSGAELRAKIETFMTLESTSEFIWVVFNMDLEQWNFTFRASLVSPFVRIMNEIFGVTHYNLATQLFSQSLFVANDRWTHYKEHPGLSRWDHHAGGNQGICQKLWTIITFCCIKQVMKENSWDHLMTGSGDNQIVAVKLHRCKNLDLQAAQVKIKLDDGFQKIGLKTKFEETWYSSRLMAYQRRYYLDGVPLANGLKNVNKAAAGTADSGAGISSLISTANNAGINLANATNDPYVGIIVALLESYAVLLCSPDSKRLKHSPMSLLATVPLGSSEFGLLPFMQLPSFLYSGHQDMLSETLGMINNLWINYPEERYRLYWLTVLDVGPDHPDLKLQLVVEPNSLNIRRPPSAEARVKDRIEQFLGNPENVINEKLRILFRSLNKEVSVNLAEELLKIRPINLNLCNSLYSYSQVGHVQSVLSKFNKLSSIAQLVDTRMRENDSNSLRQEILRVDRQLIHFIKNRLTRGGSSHQTFVESLLAACWAQYQEFCALHNLREICVFSARLFLISYTYNLPQELVKGPFVPPPADQLYVSRYPSDSEAEHAIRVSPALITPQHWKDRESSRGPFRYYAGSNTQDSVKTFKLTQLKGMEAGKALKILFKLLAWVKNGQAEGDVIKAVEGLIETRSGPIGHILNKLNAGTSGGTFTHRFAPPGVVRGCFTTSGSMISTWFQLSTNAASDLQRDEEDRHIFFQHLFQHILANLRLRDGELGQMTFVVNLDHCSYPIGSESFSGSPDVGPIVSPLVSLTSLPDETQRALQKEITHSMEILESFPFPVKMARKALAALIALQLVKAIRNQFKMSTRITVNSLRGSGPQSDYNITLVRKCKVEDILRSVILLLGHFRVFSKSAKIGKTVHALDKRLASPTTFTEVGAFTSFLEALVVGGKLVELIKLSQSPMVYDEQVSHVKLLPVLMRAIRNVATNQSSPGMKFLLPVEVQKDTFNWGSLWGTLSTWSGMFNRWSKIYSSTLPSQKVTYFNNVHGLYLVFVIEDLPTGIQAAREAISQEPKKPRLSSSSQSGPIPPMALPGFQLPHHLYEVIELREESLSSHQTEELSPISLKSVPQWTKPLMAATKWKSVSSGAKFKLLQMIGELEFEPDEEGLVITVGEGAGSFLSLLLHLFPNSKGIFNTLVLPSKLSHGHSGTHIPNELICPCDILERVINVPYDPPCLGDLTKSDVRQYLINIAAEQNEETLILTCDAEGKGTEREQLLFGVLELIQDLMPRNIVIKTYLEDWNQAAIWEITDQLSQSHVLAVCKPFSSNPWNSETYFIATPTHASVPYNCQVDKVRFKRQLLQTWTLLPSSAFFKQIPLALQWARSADMCQWASPSVGASLDAEISPVEQLLLRLCWAVDLEYEIIILDQEAIRKQLHHMTNLRTQGGMQNYQWIVASLITIQWILREVAPSYDSQGAQSLVSGVFRSSTSFEGLIKELRLAGIPPSLLHWAGRFVGECLSWPFQLVTQDSYLYLHFLLHKIKMIKEYSSVKLFDCLKEDELATLVSITPFPYLKIVSPLLESQTIRQTASKWINLILDQPGLHLSENSFCPPILGKWIRMLCPSLGPLDHSAPTVVIMWQGKDSGEIAHRWSPKVILQLSLLRYFDMVLGYTEIKRSYEEEKGSRISIAWLQKEGTVLHEPVSKTDPMAFCSTRQELAPLAASFADAFSIQMEE